MKLSQEVGIAEKNNSISVFQVYPNPVSQSATVLFSLTQPESVNIKIYDVTGREIKNLNQSNLAAGIHTLQWNADNDAGVNVENGLYLVAIETPDGSQTKSVALIK